MKRILLSLVLLFALSGTALAEGLYWESKMTGGPMGEQMSRSYALPRKFKTVEPNGTVIMRLDREVLWTLRDREKQYTEMTFAEMERMGRQAGSMMDAAMAEMDKHMASLPPEQREMMKKMMGDRMPARPTGKDAPVEVRNTGEKKTISGFACTKYVIDLGGGQQTVVWATKDVKEFDAMRKDWEDFSKRMTALMPGNSKNVGAAFAKIDGFPILTEMGQGMTTTVTKVEKRAIADSEFEVPGGYVKEKNPLLDATDSGMGGMGKAPKK